MGSPGWRRRIRDALAPSPAALGRFQIVTLLPAVNAPLAALVGALVVVGALLPLGFTLATGVLVGAVPPTIAQGFDSPSGRRAVTAGAIAGVLFVAQRLLVPLRGTLAMILGAQVERHLEARLLRAVSRPAGIAHLEDPHVVDLLATAQGVGTAGYRPGAALSALVNIVPNWIQSIGYALVLVRFRWWLAILLWAAQVYVSGIWRREYLRAANVVTGQSRALRRSGYFRDLALTPEAAKEVRIFGLGEWLVDRFSFEWARAMAAVWHDRGSAEWQLVSATLALGLGQCLAVAFLGWRAVAGEIGLTALAIYYGAIRGTGSMFTGSAGGTADDYRMEFGTAAVPAVLELERLTSDGTVETPVEAAPQNSHLGETSTAPTSGARSLGERNGDVSAGARRGRTLAGGIRLEQVTFRYPGSPPEAGDTLAGIDLFIPAGKSLAIVGANGAGKTTLIKLLCRLYEPTTGRITLDGVDLRSLPARAWQRRVAAIFQDFVQFPLPARDNVAFGAVACVADERRLVAAARRAGALDIVESLPKGWDTILSREFTGGTQLSGGQWQRIALARALFAAGGGEDAPLPGAAATAPVEALRDQETAARLLILDEPTAALDVRAEAELYDRFLELTQGLTTILISHRFSTVRRADQIVVIEAGRVREQGTHDTLMALGGRYAEMFSLQASRFADAVDAGGAKEAAGG